jgi:glyoxylase-like metal-dependent hydrolase (beta-lactamase superfamily II)
MSKKIDELIEVDKLSDRAIIVKLGYDAVVAVATQKGIVVIDAGISNSLTAKYRNIIQREFKRNDFVYLINTHSHPDHIGGNQVFADAEIIGHENCLTEIAAEWKNQEKIKSRLAKIVNDYENELDTLVPNSKEWEEVLCQKCRYQYAYNDLLKDRVVTAPTVTFNDFLDLSLGDVTLELIYFGKAHSESDIIIYIPELKLLMTGDLFFPGGRASVGDVDKQDVEQWEKAVQWLSSRANDIDVVVSGHGQIMSRKDLESFNKNIERKWEEIK